MILTGKCLEDFLKWIYNNENTYKEKDIDPQDIYYEAIKWLNNQDERLTNPLIIDYFDSVEIIIQIHNVCDDWWFRVKSKTKTIKSEKYNDHKNRKEATVQAIKRANEIRNLQCKHIQ